MARDLLRLARRPAGDVDLDRLEWAGAWRDRCAAVTARDRRCRRGWPACRAGAPREAGCWRGRPSRRRDLRAVPLPLRAEQPRSEPRARLAASWASVLELLEQGATHVGVATDHVIESFRNDLWPGYKTSAGMPRELLAQFPLIEEALEAAGVVVWPMVELEADDALGAAARTAAADRAGRAGADLHARQGPRPVRRRQGAAARPPPGRAVRRRRASRRSSASRRPSIPDYLALVGDSADGFPGLPGGGPSRPGRCWPGTATSRTSPPTGATWDGTGVRNARTLAATLRDNFELALLFRRIATVEADAPVLAAVDDLEWTRPPPRVRRHGRAPRRPRPRHPRRQARRPARLNACSEPSRAPNRP